MIRAMKFDGTFELAFLSRYEKVRSAGKDTNAIEILNGDNVIARVKLNEWIIRQDDGSITTFRPSEVQGDETGTSGEKQ